MPLRPRPPSTNSHGPRFAAADRPADDAGVSEGGATRPGGLPGAVAVQWLPIGRLTVHPRRSGSALLHEEYDALLDDVRESGVQDPLLVDAGHLILDGRLRHLAAIRCGLTSVPCRVVDLPEGEVEDSSPAGARPRNLTGDQKAVLAAIKPSRSSPRRGRRRAIKAGNAGGRGRRQGRR